MSDWLIEVQATTGDEVALTPLQARAAGENSNRWVLCVVPLARIPEILEDSARLVAQVDASARIVLGVGPQAAVTSTLVHAAVAEAVSLRNEELLRYVVRRERWTSGMTIAEWVRRLAAPGGHAAASDAS